MYLRDRTVKVLVANVLSDSIKQANGVPQGSILGPLLFLLYLNPLFEALHAIGCLYHFYGDDSQFFFEIHEGRLTSKCKEVLKCVEECFDYLKLKLNKDKTELIVFKPNTFDKKIPIFAFFGEPLIKKPSIKVLGFWLDADMNLNDQIRFDTKNCYHLKQFYSFRQFLDQDQRHLFVRCYILSRLDYCNALYYYCLLEKKLKTLQKVQNAAVQFILGKPRSPLMKELHCLPIKQQIKFKVGCLMHNVKNKNTPAYLQSRLKVNSPNPNRREMFRVPTSRINFQKAAFENSGCLFWNGLPSDVRNELNYRC